MSDYNSEVHREQREHHGKAQQKVKKQHPVNSNPAQAPIPPAPQHVVIGLNAFNSTAKLSNANWETTLSEEVQVNTGDSIFVKNAYIDTRLQTSQNILIEEDTIIELEYFFYYVNRGGSNVPSVYQDYYAPAGNQNPYITQQLRACELAQFTGTPKADGTTTNYTNVNGLPFVVIDKEDTTQETIANLAALTETIYYAPSNFPTEAQTGVTISPAATDYLAEYTEDQLRLNPMAFIMPQGINGGDGMPYLLKMVVPNNTILPLIQPFGFNLTYLYQSQTPPTPPTITDTWTGNATYSGTGIIDPNIPTYASQNPLGTFQQLQLYINWNENTGLYTAPVGNVISFGIAVGQTIKVLGTAFGGTTPLNDCLITILAVDTCVNLGLNVTPSSPPNAAYLFSAVGSASTPPPKNSLYKAPDRLIPFTKKWKQLIPAGSYTPDFLATYISRGMSIQKQKIQRDYTGASQTNPLMNTLITPTQLINSQFPPNIGIGEYKPGGGSNIDYEQAFNLPDLPIGSFQNNPTIPPFDNGGGGPYGGPNGEYYQPNLNSASKNPKSYPDPPTNPPNDPPYDPDFNNPNLNDNDDCPFIFKPFAFSNLFPLTSTDMAFSPENRIPGASYVDIPNFRLTLNDSNMNDYNKMSNQGAPRGSYNSFTYDPCIDMIYTPFLSDLNSPFYWFTENGFNQFASVPPFSNSQPPNMNYGIRPIISTMNMIQVGGTPVEQTAPLFLVPDITSPIVGASEMSLEWNVENNNLFSFGFLHNPIYSKPNPDTNEVSASVAKYPSAYCFGSSYSPANLVQGVFTADRQSGIIMKSMTSKTRSGQSTTKNFWEMLGFDVNAICAKLDSSGNPIMTYRDYIKKTTGGFSGTANIYNPEYNVRGNGEISYATYEDLNSIGGYYSIGNPENPFPEPQDYGFILNFSPIYYSVQQTNAIYAKTFPINDNDCGHVLIELQAWSLPFVNEVDYKEVKAIVSNYYVSQNSFLTQPNPESFQYYHLGPSMTISTIKCRILNPKTLQEYALLGPNSSIYVQFIKQPTLANIITGNSL